MMPKETLFRLAGWAAILAGGLRVITALWPATETSAAHEWLYLLIDSALLFAITGVYLYQFAESGMWGLIGYGLAVVGTLSIGGPDGLIGGVDIYQVGSTLIGVGMVIFAVGTLLAGKLPRYVPVLWIAATLVGVTTFVPAAGSLPFVLAGIFFGLGLVGAGLHLIASRRLFAGK